MSKAATNKLYRTFVKGLITEASPLTYPENASIDEDNTIIFRRGNRSRRLGFDFEPGYEVSPFSQLDTVAVSEARWDSAANKTNINFICVQTGATIHFYDQAVGSLSSGLKSFSVDLSLYLAPNTTNAADTPVEMVSGKGYLFVVGAKTDPIVVTYDPDADSISVKTIYIQIRDFKGLDDGLANDEEPTTLSVKHRYNLQNQGWLDAANTATGTSVSYYNTFGDLTTYPQATTSVITSFYTQFSRYPPNNKQWWVARDGTTNAFKPSLLATLFYGNNRAPRGHYVLNAFYMDRSAFSGVTGLDVEVINNRPNTTSFYSGRVWYGMDSTVYFSQVLDDDARKAGFCYQEADPTSEEISDLIATDGGVIPIPDAGKILHLIPAGSGILVFATNGVWVISGTSAGFTALDISVSKVSPVGCVGRNSIVEASGQIYWWSTIGIQAMSPKSGMFGPVEGVFDKANITEETIQTFYNYSIPQDSKAFVKGQYDPATNIIQWLYRSSSTLNDYEYDRVLNFDVTLQAFYPWSLSANGPHISGIFTTLLQNELSDSSSSIRPSLFKYVVRVPYSTDTSSYTFGYFNDVTFADWRSFDGVGKAFKSYVDTGFELLEDAMRRKWTSYVYCYFRRTEENYVADGDDYSADKPSSCKFQIKWDWASGANSNKWSTKIEAYRLTRVPMFDESDLTFDTGFPIVVTRNKVRGSGRAIQFRFESDRIGYDFDLLGWAVAYSGNTQP